MCDIHASRLNALRSLMKENNVNLTVICNSPNLFYMTGYAPKKCERLLVALVPLDSDPLLIVSKIYSMDSEKMCNIRDQRAWQDGDDILKLVKDILVEKNLIGKTIAIDDTTTFAQTSYFLCATPNSVFMPASGMFSKMRMRKSPEEVEQMRESGKLTDKAIGMLIDSIMSGKSEMQLHNWIEYELGSQGMRQGFSNLIASGVNTASIHHVSGDRIPQIGDAVYLDIGGAYKHYWSDATRSFHIGKPSVKYVDTYNRVKEAQQLAADAVKPGVRACDVDAVARNYLAKYDLAKYFVHRLGHGVGLDGHERPNLSPDETIILEPGMSFSCEPGVYFNGEWGIRIEDTIIVTEKGHESFNSFTKDLIIL